MVCAEKHIASTVRAINNLFAQKRRTAHYSGITSWKIAYCWNTIASPPSYTVVSGRSVFVYCISHGYNPIVSDSVCTNSGNASSMAAMKPSRGKRISQPLSPTIVPSWRTDSLSPTTIRTALRIRPSMIPPSHGTITMRSPLLSVNTLFSAVSAFFMSTSWPTWRQSATLFRLISASNLDQPRVL